MWAVPFPTPAAAVGVPLGLRLPLVLGHARLVKQRTRFRARAHTQSCVRGRATDAHCRAHGGAPTPRIPCASPVSVTYLDGKNWLAYTNNITVPPINGESG